MSRSNRRSFIQQALASSFVLSKKRGQVQQSDPAGLPTDLLQALGRAVLPSKALGPVETDRVIDDFSAWLAGYQPVAEMNHGYMTGRIRYSPEHPQPRWASQLEALEIEAQKRFHVPFTELDQVRRRELVEKQIGSDRIGRLPRAASARHVAVGLLAYFYATPAATDLAYRAEISRHACRPLAQASRRPRSLEDGQKE